MSSLRPVQTRRASLAEAVLNVIIGFWIAMVTQALVFPLFGIATSFATDFKIAIIFTAVSIARSYLMRRTFERFNRS